MGLEEEIQVLRRRHEADARLIRAVKEEAVKWRGRYRLADKERTNAWLALRAWKNDAWCEEDLLSPREQESDLVAFHKRLRDAVISSPDRGRLDKPLPYSCTECRIPFDEDEVRDARAWGQVLCRLCRGILARRLQREALEAEGEVGA